MDKLETMDEKMGVLEAQLVLVRIDVATLKVKSGLWGAAAGLVPAALTIAIAYLGGG